MATDNQMPGPLSGALARFAPGRRVAEVENVSMTVSTNRVYRVLFDDGLELFAKVSSYGSYVHFKKDHELVHQWASLLSNTPYEHFLARVALKQGRVFTHREGGYFVAFYHKVPFYDFLPRVLTDGQVEALGREMARFHREGTRVAEWMDPTWKTVGSDISILYDALGHDVFLDEQGLAPELADVLREHCDVCLEQSERLGYHDMPHIPVLVDWNITNFSVGLDRDGFRFFSRWDYDWFRLEPRVFDFYFCARVVRSEGDRTVFSYSADPFFDPRFERFVRAYHAEFPLTPQDILMQKEAYRFFLLNYVLRVGQHFYRPEIRRRLQRETVEKHLPALADIQFDRLLGALT
ncbi:MAG: hypothetical protein OXU20_28445 [Myxococcales bacterium]|nr:hypothetical protein [Myxococcales bacterium]MDD9968529.1 hypothetical protein [Myxococcales bacterium]